MRSTRSNRLFDTRTRDDKRLVAEIERAAAPLVAIAAGVYVLRRFPPEESDWYLRCPVYELLHLKCPGCGATRAVAEMLRGDFSAAVHLNALATLLLPVAAVYGMYLYYRFVRHEVSRWPQVPTAAVYVAMTVAMLFMVFRNLPVSMP